MFGVPPNTFPLVLYIRDILLLGIITLQHVIQNNLMVLSDGMVHFLKIKKFFNKSTKTIVALMYFFFFLPNIQLVNMLFNV